MRGRIAQREQNPRYAAHNGLNALLGPLIGKQSVMGLSGDRCCGR